MREATTIVDDEHDAAEPPEPAWHNRTGVMVGAGLGVIVALALLVFAVTRTAEHAKDRPATPIPAISSVPGSTTSTTLVPYTPTNGAPPPAPSTRDVTPTEAPPPSTPEPGGDATVEAPTSTWERYPSSTSTAPADAV